jgi:hypothetical protein
MKTTSRFLLLLSLPIMLLSGCASLTGQTGNTAQSSGLSSDLTLSTKTGLGILELEGQTLAIDTEQARALLPLWQALQTLSSDSNTSPDEIASLNDQIEENLTSEQLAAIKEMSWKEDDLSALVQEYAASSSQPGNLGGSTAATSLPDGAVMGAGMPGGAPMAGGGGEMMAMGITGGSTSTATSHSTIAGQEDRESAGGLNLVFAPAVIELLQSKITLA